MKQSVIDLNALAVSHSCEIERLSSGIRGDGSLWTSELRATTRGGKPCFVPRVDDDPR